MSLKQLNELTLQPAPSIADITITRALASGSGPAKYTTWETVKDLFKPYWWTDIQSSIVAYAVASGTNTYTATLSPAIASYTSGMQVRIKFTNANTGASTINLNGIGAIPLKKNVSTALTSGDIIAGSIITLNYDGTNFQLITASGTVTNVSALTIGTSGSDLTSTVANSTTTPVITLNVPTASATNRGALSSSDWTTFNGKQNALSGTGIVKSTSGTISYLTDNSSNWDSAYTFRLTTLTTLGSSGASTLISNVLNIPTYTLSGLGGISYTDLSSSATGLSYNNINGVFSLTSGYVIPTTTQETNWNTAYTNRITSATSPLGITSNVISIQQGTTTTDGYISRTDWNTFNSKQNALNGTGFVKISGTTISYDNSTYLTANQAITITATGEATGTSTASGTAPSIALTLTNSSVIGKVLTGLSITGGSIIATDSILTAFGKLQNQVTGLVGGVSYQGTWNASTNSPSLTSSSGTKGYYYVVATPGSTNLDGITDWKLGDWAIYNGATWNKVDNTDAVISVNGYVGAVTLTTNDIGENTNLYFTPTRAQNSITLTTTGSSGASTYSSGTLNVPTYTLSGLGGIGLTSLSSSATGLTYTNTTGVFSLTSGYVIPTTTQETNWTTAYTNRITSLTTTGSSGSATLSSNTLNIPTYTLSGLGGQPALSGTGFVKISGTTISYDNSTYLTSLSGAVLTTTNQNIDGQKTFISGVTNWDNAFTNQLNFYVSGVIKASILSSSAYYQFRSYATGGYLFKNSTAQNSLSIADTNEATFLSSVTASSFVKSGGTSSQFLKADGSVDTTTYGLGTVTSVGLSAPTGFSVSNSPIISSGTMALSFASGYSLPTTSSQTNWNTAYTNRISSLTTTGTSGAATLISNVLNIPDYTYTLPTASSTVLGGVKIGTGITITLGVISVSTNYQAPITLTTTGSSGASTFVSNTLNIPTYTLAGLGGISLTSLSSTATGLTYTNTTGVFSLTSGYVIPTTTQETNWTTAYTNRITSLTTTGSSGSATLISNTLNIPTYTLSGLGGQPALSGTGFVKISGTTISYDNSTYLTANQAITVTATGEATGTSSASGTAPSIALTLTNSAVIGKVLTGLSITGGSITSSDSILSAFGKLQNQVTGLVGGVSYQGTWNASTNSPSLTSSSGTKGYYYVVATPGSTNLDGITDWKLGDWVIFNGTTWNKVDNTDAVVSVNGYTGAVSLTTLDVTENTNLYFTPTRAQNAITLTTTGSSGASTYTTGTLNIPTYTLSGLGGQPLSTNLTSLSGLTYASTSFVKMTASGTFALDTNTYLTSAVTSIATAGLISGGTITTTGTITTSMATNKLVGRSTAGTGVMEEITIGSGLSLSGGTLSASTVSGTIPHATATGTDTYAATISGVTAYNDGDAYLIQFTNGNTTTSTLNINSIGDISLYRNNDGVLIGGDIVANGEMLCIYDSTITGFRLIGTSPNTLLSYITNADSVSITKGQPVYAFGGTGDRMTVKRALNTSDSTSAQTVGLVLSSSIASGQKGLILMQGLLDGLSILPTSTFADGDPIYLGATAGSITNVKPSAPNHLVYLGVVTTSSNGSAGRMYVRVQNGYELDELHDVSIVSKTDRDLLMYESATTLWKNKTLVKGDVGLSNVDNTSDANKPVSTATQTALNLKVDGNTAITGATKTKITYDSKGLVTAGADATTADIADSTNKRYVTDANLVVIGNTSGTNSGDNAVNSNYSGLATSKEDTSNKVTTFTGNETSTTKFPVIKAILDYFTASNIKTILGITTLSGSNTGDQDLSGYQLTSAEDASGGYVGLTLFKINFKNVLNTFTSYFTNSNTASRTYTFQDRNGTIADDTDLGTKQDTLVSGTNIKTINSNSILGSGNILISSAVAWGAVTGTLSSQTDLQTALDNKVDENTAITGATKTKITYDTKGLVTAGADATTADIADSTNKRYVTDAQLVIIGNTSGTNTGDNSANSLYSGLATSKQDTLVSGTNIKTINTVSLLGSSDISLPTTSSTDTFTNKRITSRVSSVTSSATPSVNTDSFDAVTITALAATITGVTVTGTPTDFQRLIFRIKDNGTARGITWGASFEAKGVALPTTTVISKVLTVGFIYDSVSTKWGCVASAQQA